jgi:DNA-binding PucR family transcriptional regulator
MLVVDSILSGENEQELASRIAALGWRARGSVAVLVGNTSDEMEVEPIRRLVRRNDADILIGIHGNRLIAVLGHINSTAISEAVNGFLGLATQLEPLFGPGALVLGPEVATVSDGHKSSKAALSGFAVVRAWPKASRPIPADDLLAERALAGDMLAKSTLIQRIYRPLAEHSPELLDTLGTYLESGRSLETTARELFVHPNTVRYRLKKISEIIGWDATGAREAFILQVAMVLGSMSETDSRKRR